MSSFGIFEITFLWAESGISLALRFYALSRFWFSGSDIEQSSFTNS